MLTFEQASLLAAKWFSGVQEPKLVEEDDFWRVYIPGRTSVSLLIGPDGGALFYHITEKTDEQAKADYLNGERSQSPDSNSMPQSEQLSDDEKIEIQQHIAASQQKINEMLKQNVAKAE